MRRPPTTFTERPDLPGCSILSSTVRAAFTIYVRGGSITESGTARLNSGKGEYASFGGALAAHGSGRYAPRIGTGRIYGTIARRDQAAPCSSDSTATSVVRKAQVLAVLTLWLYLVLPAGVRVSEAVSLYASFSPTVPGSRVGYGAVPAEVPYGPIAGAGACHDRCLPRQL